MEKNMNETMNYAYDVRFAPIHWNNDPYYIETTGEPLPGIGSYEEALDFILNDDSIFEAGAEIIDGIIYNATNSTEITYLEIVKVIDTEYGYKVVESRGYDVYSICYHVEDNTGTPIDATADDVSMWDALNTANMLITGGNKDEDELCITECIYKDNIGWDWTRSWTIAEAEDICNLWETVADRRNFA